MLLRLCINVVVKVDRVILLICSCELSLLPRLLKLLLFLLEHGFRRVNFGVLTRELQTLQLLLCDRLHILADRDLLVDQISQVQFLCRLLVDAI